MKKIGILNVTEHLEDTVEGFKKGCAQERIDSEYIYFNAQGKESRLAGYARKILNEDVDIVFACGTPAALALRDVMGNRQVPVVYAPVFNPYIAGLVDPSHHVLAHFTGVSGMVKQSLRVDMMKKIFADIKKITVFYDPEDFNSVFDLQRLAESIRENKLDYGEVPLRGGKMSMEVLDSLHGPVLLAFSMKIEEQIEHWIEEGIEQGLPVVASGKRGAVTGCLAGLYTDHYPLGEMAALKAKAVLSGEGASGLEISYPDDCKIVCNYMTATRLNFDFPAELTMCGDIC